MGCAVGCELTAVMLMLQNGGECNEAMEGVIRVMTFTGWRTMKNESLEPRKWLSMDKPG